MPVQCTCLTCGKSFTKSPSDIALGRGKYCKRACADAGRVTIVTMTCAQCGVSFERPQNRSRGAVHQFCSESCARLARRSRVDLTCEQCGSAFTRNTAAVAAGRGRFCSRTCKDAAQENKVSLTCETCGTTFERRMSAVHDRVFCSDECARLKHAQPIVLSEDGLTARVPLLARDGSIVAYALIDASDAEWVGQWTWSLNAHGYASRGQGILLHRELLGLMRGDDLNGDHFSRTKLDNRRSNLRPATDLESTQNVPGRPGTSAYRGVSWYPKTGKWVAYCQVNGKRHHLGYFIHEEEAANAAREARQLLMPFAID